MPDTSHRLQVAVAGRYRVERELSRSSMATVFLAEDLKHHRRVALKVLDPELASAIGHERFLREIETIAHLTHPHILPLHDSGAVDDLLYYVMPYVEGESLRHRLAREAPLPIAEALRLAREVADALEHAHRAGIVHRDIKPENVLLEGGHAVVADFGIARALGPAGPDTLTAEGVTLGTPAYMSPEQAAGAHVLDGRSDQYSLGCMLYELLAGQPPFTGPNAQSLLYQHLNVAPRPVTDLRPTVPGPVCEALARALGKLPADRFTVMAEFATAIGAEVTSHAATGVAMAVELAPTAELPAATGASVQPSATTVPPKPRRLRGPRMFALAAGVVAIALPAVFAWQRWGKAPATPPAGRDWILVAAFEGPPDDSSLAVVARDLLCAAIDQSRSVASVPRSQVVQALQAAGRPPNTRVDADLARELAYRSAVRTVLDGRIGRIGGGYSVVLRLVDAESARTILTETRTAKDADALIPVLGELAKRLRARLGENRLALAATRPMGVVATPSFEAYKLYLQGLQRGRLGDNVQAKAFHRAAIALDPDFAMAWGALRFPYANIQYPDSVVLVCDEALRRPDRLTADQRKQILNSRLRADGDWQGAIASLDRALLENPDDMWALTAGNDLLWDLGRYEDALARVRRLQRLRPFGPAGMDSLNEMWSLSLLGRFDEARRVAAGVPGVWGPWVSALNELLAGNYATAESLTVAMSNDPRQVLENTGGPEFLLGQVRRARGSLASADSCDARFLKVAGERARAFGDVPYILRGQLVFKALLERTVPPLAPATRADTTAAVLVNRGLQAAYLGEREEARRCLERARKRPRRELVWETTTLPLLQATLDGADGRWDQAAKRLQPIAISNAPIAGINDDVLSWVRWTLADAYERLGRADSAVACLERITREPRVRTFRAYASLRLVPLHARLGRGEDARRHWRLAERALSTPDPPVRARIEAARATIASLE